MMIEGKQQKVYSVAELAIKSSKQQGRIIWSINKSRKQHLVLSEYYSVSHSLGKSLLLISPMLRSCKLVVGKNNTDLIVVTLPFGLIL